MEHSVTTGGTIIAAACAAIGWVVVYFLSSWRDDRTKRLQLEIEHASAQIKHFYAPLVALTDQLDTTVDVLETVTDGKVGGEYHKLAELMYDRFFLPIHEEINAILKTKVHLLEGATAPPSL
jgi:hypothetical protein